MEKAVSIGAVNGLIHAAGVSPTQASPETILKVDLYGTALVLEEFGNVMAPGGAGVVIASQSGHRLPALTPEQNKALATTPTDQLLALPDACASKSPILLHAYQLCGCAATCAAGHGRGGADMRAAARSRQHAQSRHHHHAIGQGRTGRARRGPGYRRMLEYVPVGRAGTAR